MATEPADDPTADLFNEPPGPVGRRRNVYVGTTSPDSGIARYGVAARKLA